MNEHCGKPLNNSRLLGLMGELEGRISGSIHYDNVAPCFLGGMQLMIEENGIISQQVPGFDEWLWVLAYPGIKVSTAEARAILPAQYRRQDCIAHGRHGRLYSRLLYPSATAGGEIDERCDCRTVSYEVAAALMRRDRHRLILARRRAAFPAPARRCSPCAISQTPRSAWRTGSLNTTCKIRKALFIFAVWTRLAHEYWDNE